MAYLAQNWPFKVATNTSPQPAPLDNQMSLPCSPFGDIQQAAVAIDEIFTALNLVTEKDGETLRLLNASNCLSEASDWMERSIISLNATIHVLEIVALFPTGLPVDSFRPLVEEFIGVSAATAQASRWLRYATTHILNARQLVLSRFRPTSGLEQLFRCFDSSYLSPFHGASSQPLRRVDLLLRRLEFSTRQAELKLEALHNHVSAFNKQSAEESFFSQSPQQIGGVLLNEAAALLEIFIGEC
ncbi:hypothetical protein Hypma_003318 [Hypsizygus marmoreus]|uniref:Uncharacterized protein n=1 Tax=Hypsizygus marmoreus TaxID=39966 RepID=A0A369J6F2_HYPMA|nr:hypothetical protein Hypma_003318 [Hypsizygus marmoreus]